MHWSEYLYFSYTSLVLSVHSIYVNSARFHPNLYILYVVAGEHNDNNQPVVIIRLWLRLELLINQVLHV